ncbi:microsomal glutathione S-transferase 1-like [Clavelina lepadiformis]|uniref:microsomal glutathione S-transferase 1-like n=1 Tax=Clavelina lepadiformis TaxID=159417 RepID=UPI0040421D09
MSSPFTLQNKAFSGLVFYGSLALVKTAVMSEWTGYFRVKNRAFANLEDAKMFAGKDKDKQKESLRKDDQVERVRRAHLNDLENVVPFVLSGLLYVGTDPDPTTALWHFRVFLAARVLHSLVYVNGVRQPSRMLTFWAGLFTTLSMAYRTIRAVC